MIDFILPDIGEGIVECELLKWLVTQGDTVIEDQPVAEVMTDKATVEIPAMHNGVVTKLYYKEGEIAKVHQPLFAMEQSDHITTKQESVNIVEETVNKSAVETTLQKIESFLLPDIGEGIVECEIMQWHISEGDVVQEDQVVVEVMTDKAVVEIPAKYNGRIVKLNYKKGDIAGVHTSLFEQALDVIGDSSSADKDSPTISANDPAFNANTQQQHQTLNSEENKQGESFEPPIEVNRALASPAVRRIAREHGLLLSKITPTGAKGRILKQDVLNLLASDAKQDSQTTIEKSTQNDVQSMLKPSSQPFVAQGHDTVENIKGIRAAMAKQMMASVSTIPHFSVSDELCMDKLIQLRTRLKPVFEAEGVKLSFLPFFIKALSLAMASFPVINSRLNEQATELTYLGSHNIGIAVDSKIGLLVPNIKNVQNLSLFEVAQQLNAIIERARQGKLTNADLTGGSISISNVGAIGGITATPVINKPEVAIVALGKTQKLPRYNEEGAVAATNMMMINWSGDHRVVDGATMVKFNNLWMDYLCNPELMLVHLR